MAKRERRSFTKEQKANAVAAYRECEQHGRHDTVVWSTNREDQVRRVATTDEGSSLDGGYGVSLSTPSAVWSPAATGRASHSAPLPRLHQYVS
jgi:hypothetical protein